MFFGGVQVNSLMENLNDKIWTNDKLIPDIKEKLLITVRKILADLEIDVKLKNVFFTGSLASFVYRASSDIDLHIIVDPVGNYDEIADEYFDLYCKLFNSHRSIFIKGYKLEVNVKREEKVLDNKGIYDIITGKWKQYPTPPSEEMSKNEELKDLVVDYQDQIDDLINTDADIEILDALRNEIKELRTAGLAEDGEYSLGNLVFKELRYSGYIKKLFDFKLKKEDEYLSVESFSKLFKS